MRNPLEVTTTTASDGTTVVSFTGELDMDSSRRAEQEIRWTERAAPSRIVLDLRGLSFIDSSGIRLVVAADSRARSAGRKFDLVAGSPAVQRVFKVTSLENRLSFVEPESLGL